jgi:hypothetical protein
MLHMEVESFSLQDTRATLSDLDDRTSTMNQDIEMVSNRIREREELGGGSTTDLRERMNYFQSIQVSDIHAA